MRKILDWLEDFLEEVSITMVKGIHIQMHRFILNPSRKMQVDHINGNGLDNRRENLRIVTPSENQLNVRNRYGYRSAA